MHMEHEDWKSDRGLAAALIFGLAPVTALAVRFDVAVVYALIAVVVVFLTTIFLHVMRDLVKPAWLLAYAMVGAGLLVTLFEVLLSLFAPALKQLIGIFLPILAVAPLVLTQVETALRDESLGVRLSRSAGISGRFFGLMILMGAVRELLADGSLTLVADLPRRVQLVVPGLSTAPVGFLASAAGGLLLAGLLLALRNWIKLRRARKTGDIVMEDQA